MPDSTNMPSLTCDDAQGAKGARFDAVIPAVIVNAMTLDAPGLVAEATRWATGARGEAVSVSVLDGADLTEFVRQAATIGAQAITVAGGAQEKFDLERLVREVGDRTARATSEAAEATQSACHGVAEALTKVSVETTKVITEAGAGARKEFSERIEATTQELRAEVLRLFGGEHPELLSRLGPVLDGMGATLERKVAEQADAMVAKVARQFDPADATTPMARHLKALQDLEDARSKELVTRHAELASKVDDLVSAVGQATAGARAAAVVTNVTTLKGAGYEAMINAVMDDIAHGLGDEYLATGTVVGNVAGSKKGDGVLAVAGGQARIVVEAADNRRREWGPYLAEAERNRDALASLGLVPTLEQNGGHTFRSLGARRLVVAFDPERDDPDLLRIVVQLLKTAAMSATSRRDLDGASTAAEKVTEAITLLEKLDGMLKTAGTIRKGAEGLETNGRMLRDSLNRLLVQAQQELTGVASVRGPGEPGPAATPAA